MDKCPKCELNYKQDDEKYCMICSEGLTNEDDEEMCIVCGKNKNVDALGVCAACVEAGKEEEEEEDKEDVIEIDGYDKYIDGDVNEDDIVVGEEEAYEDEETT